MRNMEIATVLEETADFLEMEDVAFKPRSYRRAAEEIARLGDPIEQVHEEGRLTEIPGVGDSIADDIAAFLDDGEIPRHAAFKEETPVDMQALTRVATLGPKRVKKLYDALGIRDLDSLEEAARAGAIQDVPGFGEDSQENILDAIHLAHGNDDRTLLGKAIPLVNDLTRRLEAETPIDTITPVGSFRRQEATVGDVDLLALAHDPKEAIQAFTSLDEVDEIITQGTSRSSVRLSSGLQIDLLIVNKASYGAAILYFTGSKEHNVSLRKEAQKHGFKLNEHGLFEENERIAGATEDDVYNALGLAWIAPELREATGEIQAAKEGTLPDLVHPTHIQGDLHMHTTRSDGRHTLQAMADHAESLGHGYILVTDHGPKTPTAEATPDLTRHVKEEAQRVNDTVETTVLAGIEANIQPDGSLDVPDEALEGLDLVIASHHEATPDATDRITTAIEDHPIDILGHATNRRLGKRDPNPLDYERITRACATNHVAIEINSQPSRLDPPWRAIKDHIRDRIPLVITTDAHSTHDLENLPLGVAQARRAWLTPEHVLNTRPLEEVLEHLRP